MNIPLQESITKDQSKSKIHRMEIMKIKWKSTNQKIDLYIKIVN